MANNWNIPDLLEEEVKRRDKQCVYCGVEFTPASVSKKTSASWEHIVNDGSSTSRKNIALCCYGCNSSKGLEGTLGLAGNGLLQAQGYHSRKRGPHNQEITCHGMIATSLFSLRRTSPAIWFPSCVQGPSGGRIRADRMAADVELTNILDVIRSYRSPFLERRVDRWLELSDISACGTDWVDCVTEDFLAHRSDRRERR